MADIRKVATRQSYGEALVELGAARDDFVVLDADLAAASEAASRLLSNPIIEDVICVRADEEA